MSERAPKSGRRAFPDPCLTASIYCAGRLDELIHSCVAPLWRGFRQQTPHQDGYLWLVRYNRCGEHLKLRLHGSEAERALLERMLTEATDRYFAAASPAPDGPRQEGRKNIPPIDVEDQATSDYPDRKLLFTHYQRSYVSLGGKPLIDDDDYAALLTSCLGAGCERALDALRPDETGQVPFRLRQGALLKAVTGGLAAMEFTAEQRVQYLAYHRDWLIRFGVAQNQQDPEKALDLLRQFDLRVEKMSAVLPSLRAALGAPWAEGGAADDKEASFPLALRDMASHIAAFRGDPGYLTDPFAADPVFPAVFKAFHGLANQLGLRMFDEGFAYHLLLSAVADSKKVGFALEPPVERAS